MATGVGGVAKWAWDRSAWHSKSVYGRYSEL